MSDVEKILPLFIHDLRTPIGVAQGYVRLLQEQRLASAEEQERALARTMDALGRLSRLCNEASAFLADASAAPIATVNASELAGLVHDKVEGGRPPVTSAIDPTARLSISGDPGRLAEAIAVVLGAVTGRGGELAESVLMETRMSELCLMATRKGSSPTPTNHPRAPFDPWRGHGLGVALACHAINNSQGVVSTTDSGVLVALPLEVLS